MAAFLQILVNGVLFGSMYGVAAIGLSLIFGTMQIIFIAQGAMMILAAYITYWIFTLTSVDPFFWVSAGFFMRGFSAEWQRREKILRCSWPLV